MRTRTKQWLLLLPVAALLGVAISAQGQVGENALDIYLEEHPAALEEGTLGPLEARMLEAMTPEQAEAYAGGADPAEIVLEGGETLAEFMAGLLAGGKGLVYVPLDSCTVFRTSDSTAGQMAAGETREFFVRGTTTDLSAQGGSATGCLVPTEAVAVAMHFRVRVMSAGVVGRLRVGRSGGPMPNRAMEYLRQGPDGGHAGLSVFGLCEGTCATGEFGVTTEAAAAQVRGDVIGYFRAIELTDLPAGVGVGDADTLDGLDSTDFALTSHTHDGGDITSGTVGEPFVDSQIARDDEIVPTVLASDGSGSGLDADLLDGKELTAFRPRPQNVVLVDAGGGGDFTTLGAALASITTATTSNRFLVRVADGTYTEQVAMKPFVDIEGKGKHLTVITSASCPTVEGADDAELRHLEVECDVAGAADSAIAIRNLGVSPMLTELHINASNGNVDNTGVLNDGAAAMPMLDHVWIYAGALPTVTDIAVRNVNGAAPTIRNSGLAGNTAAIRNEDTATAKIANTQLMGAADVAAPAVQASYMCVRAYIAGTLQQLNAECFPNTPPTATDDSYATLGNTLLEVDLAAPSGAPAVIGPDPGPVYADVLANDIDAETPGSLTAAVVPGSVTAGAAVVMNADGSFSYTPPVGFTGATDSFDYTLTDAGGLTDTGTVEVAVSQMIWYVDNDNAGTADGRSATPYTSLAPIDAGGADDGKDGTGDTIFVFDGTGTTAGGILLEDNQILQGHELALDFAGFGFAAGSVLVASSTAPTIGDTTGDVIELASGNTVRGLDIAATNGLAISGNGVAGVTIDEVGTSGTASGNGVLFDGVTGTIALADLDVNSSSNWGVAIQNSSATFTFDAASSITNPTGVAFSVVSGAPNVTYSGTITNSSILSVNVSSTTGGTVLFDGSSINGTRVALSSVGGNVTVDADATTLDKSFSSGISITGASTGTFRFDDVTISSPTSSGIDINGLTGNVDFNNVDVSTTSASPVVSIAGLGAGAGGVDFDAASAVNSTNGGITITSNAGGTMTFNGPATLNTAGLPAVSATSNSGATINFAGNLDIDTTIGAGFNVTGGGTVTVDSSTSSTMVDTGTGIGVHIGAGIGGAGVSFDTVNVNGAIAGIILVNTGPGTFNVTGGTIQNITGSGVAAASFANVDGTVNIGASISNLGGHSVEILSNSAGAFTFSGAIDDNAQGIDISSNSPGGTFTFKGGTDVDTIGSDFGLRAFSGGTINVCADSNCGTGGGTPVFNTVNTTAGTGTAVSIDGVTIGSAGTTFQRIDADAGSGPAIVLANTGAGPFTVTGVDGPCGRPGATDCDGGTIENLQGDAITLSNTGGLVSLSNMLIEDIGATTGGFDTRSGHDAIHGQNVDGGLTLDNVTIRRISDMGINGTLFAPGMGDPTTVWNGLTITDSHIANTNRFDPALTTVADDSDEGGVRILGLRGTTTLNGNLFERGGTLVQLFVTSATGPLPGTTTITVTENDFRDAYKEFASGGTLSKGITCLDIIAQATGNVDATVGSRTTTTVGHQANDDGNLFLNCHGASVRYGNDSVSPFGLTAASGDVDAVIGNNTFRSTDHDSAQSGDFDFPRGYLLAITRGLDSATLDTRISYNLFDEVSFDGGLGQLNLDFEDGIHQAKVDFNTFDSPGHGPWFVRADSSASAKLLFRDNTGIRGPFCSGDPSAAGGGCDLGGGNLCSVTAENPSAEGYCGPGESAIAQAQIGGVLDMGIIDDRFALEDAFYTIGETVRIRTVNSGAASTICAYLSDNTSPNGYGLQEDGPTTLEVEQGASASTDPATVLGDNNNTGTPKNIIGGVSVTSGTCARPTGSLFN